MRHVATLLPPSESPWPALTAVSSSVGRTVIGIASVGSCLDTGSGPGFSAVDSGSARASTSVRASRFGGPDLSGAGQ